MSLEYDIYLKKHIEAVRHGFSWIMTYCPPEDINDALPELNCQSLATQIIEHDASKYDGAEYSAYDRYLYGNEKTEGIKTAFKYARLHHMHSNPHHWQYWVLISGDGYFDSDVPDKFIALDMPDNYIFEMIVDWWAFSWIKRQERLKDIPTDDTSPTFELDEIFTWYRENKDNMKLSELTRAKVEVFLDLLERTLDEIDRKASEFA